MSHRFQTPRVVEIAPIGAFPPDRTLAGKPSQRTLVAESLLRCPQRDRPKPRA